mgnify:CR=1
MSQELFSNTSENDLLHGSDLIALLVVSGVFRIVIRSKNNPDGIFPDLSNDTEEFHVANSAKHVSGYIIYTIRQEKLFFHLFSNKTG